MVSLKRLKLKTRLKRLALPVAVTLFALLLGLFENVGYQINASHIYIDLASSGTSGSTTAYNVYIDTTFNPILHPFHWLTEQGSMSGNMTSLMKYAGGNMRNFWGRLYHAPGTADRSQYPFQGDAVGEYVSPAEAVKYSALTLASIGFTENAIIIATVSILIEALQQRFLYLILLAGTVGFTAGTAGMITAIAIALVIYIIYKLIPHQTNPLRKLLNFILERNSTEQPSYD